MAHSARTRSRARRLYVDRGHSYDQVSDETAIARTTLMRWGGDGRWKEARETRAKLQTQSMELMLEMMREARESGDPQQAYAAAQAAKVAGALAEPDERPAPEKVAEALLAVLARDPDVGAVVRRFRRRVLDAVMAEVADMDETG